MGDVIEYRPKVGTRRRWAQVPPGYTASEAVFMFGQNYELRINGKVVEAT